MSIDLENRLIEALQSRNQRLELWAVDAARTIKQGAELMTADQQAQWNRFRELMQSCPVDSIQGARE